MVKIKIAAAVFILAASIGFLSCHSAKTGTSSGEKSGAEPLSLGENNTNTSGIFSRRTARNFSLELPAPEYIDSIIKAAFASPTGGNQHACEFIVVSNRNTMQNMKGGNPYSGALDTAALAIVIAANYNTAIYPELLAMDTGIAAQSIMVRAAELGLNSVPMSIAPQETRINSVSKALKLPSGLVPQIMICIGYPVSDAVSSASTDFYDKGKVHYNTY